MTESAADDPAVENACRDIDRYVSELSNPSANDGQPLSPSQRLRLLVKQQTEVQPAAPDMATPPTNKF